MKTWIDDVPRTETGPLAPVPSYKSVEDLPLPLRAQFVALARKGMSNQKIADFFSLPVEWVQLFTECPPGSLEH